MTQRGEEIRFLSQILRDAERALVVPPEHGEAARELVLRFGEDSAITVRTSTGLPPGTAFMVDEWALDALHRQAVQRVAHELRDRAACDAALWWRDQALRDLYDAEFRARFAERPSTAWRLITGT
jgi:hypothetical protein